jgi:serine/threonine protein kinase
MELVEGPTLTERIRQGPLPLEEALAFSQQIAEGLEYAHERGIIHRDLKPSNVKLTPESQVKLLDFGLAKALEGETIEGESQNSPTLSAAATRTGVLPGICRRSRRGASAWIAARTSGPSAACSTKCSPGWALFPAKPLPTFLPP